MADRMRNAGNSGKSMLSRFRGRLGIRKPGSVTALDVDGQVLRVVQTAPRVGRTAVTRIAAERLDYPADADRGDPAILGAAIAKTLGRMRLNPGPVVMGVPRAQVVLRTLLVPVVSDLRELASVVHLQIGKDLPFRVEDAVIDFRVNRRLEPTVSSSGEAKPGEGEGADTGGPRLEVLVAATKREIVEHYKKIAEVAGLKLVALGWLSYANARSAEACRVTSGNEVVGLVSLRPDELGIDVLAEQTLLFSRGAVIKLHGPATPTPPPIPPPMPTVDETETPDSPTAAPGEPSAPTAPATYEDAVLLEVVRTLHAYGGMSPHQAVSKILVAGATGSETPVVEAIQKRLNVPTQVLDPAQAMDLPKAARDHAAGAISALGLALGFQDPRGLPFDFLNPKRPAVRRNLARIRVIAGAAAVAALLLLLFAVQSRYIKEKDALYAKVKAEYDSIAKRRTAYKQMRVQATVTQGWQKGAKPWLDHYAYLSSVLPASEEIYITSFSIGPQGNIRLALQARNGGIMAKLDKMLRAAGYEVKPLAITPGPDKHGYDFRSNVELIVSDKMTIDLAKMPPPPARPPDDISLEGAKAGRRGGGS